MEPPPYRSTFLVHWLSGRIPLRWAVSNPTVPVLPKFQCNLPSQPAQVRSPPSQNEYIPSIIGQDPAMDGLGRKAGQLVAFIPRILIESSLSIYDGRYVLLSARQLARPSRTGQPPCIKQNSSLEFATWLPIRYLSSSSKFSPRQPTTQSLKRCPAAAKCHAGTSTAKRLVLWWLHVQMRRNNPSHHVLATSHSTDRYLARWPRLNCLALLTHCLSPFASLRCDLAVKFRFHAQLDTRQGYRPPTFFIIFMGYF